jgi:cell division septation protein DedD
MKRTFVLTGIIILLFILSSGRLQAQSDKVIIKTAKAMLDRKSCDSAFFQVLTVKKTKSGKVQDIIKKAYPGLISKQLREANSIKIGDKENDQVKCEKLQQMIGVMKISSLADSLLNLNVKPDVYKQLSKKKSVDKSLSAYEKRLAASRENIIKLERLKRIQDSIAVADSIKQVHFEDSLRMAQDAALARVNDSIAALSVKKNKTANTPVVKEKVVTPAVKGKTVTPAVKETAVTPVTTRTSGKRYYIIAGAYKTQEDAQMAVDKLKGQGFLSEIVNKNPFGNFRVSYNSYETYEDALKDLENIKSKYSPEAWILEK